MEKPPSFAIPEHLPSPPTEISRSYYKECVKYEVYIEILVIPLVLLWIEVNISCINIRVK